MRTALLFSTMLALSIGVSGCHPKEVVTVKKVGPPGFIRIVNLSSGPVACFSGTYPILANVGAGEDSVFTTLSVKAQSVTLQVPIDYKALHGQKPGPAKVLETVTLDNKSNQAETIIYNGKSSAVVSNDLESIAGDNLRFVTYDGSKVMPLANGLKVGAVSVKAGQATAMVAPGSYTIGGKDLNVVSQATYLVLVSPNGKVFSTYMHKPRKPIASGTSKG